MSLSFFSRPILKAGQILRPENRFRFSNSTLLAPKLKISKICLNSRFQHTRSPPYPKYSSNDRLSAEIADQTTVNVFLVPTTDQPGSRNNLFIWKMRARSLILVISYQIPRFCCRLWGTVSSPILVRFYIFLMFWKATMLIHSFLAILSSLATLGWHSTTEFIFLK